MRQLQKNQVFKFISKHEVFSSEVWQEILKFVGFSLRMQFWQVHKVYQAFIRHLSSIGQAFIRHSSGIHQAFVRHSSGIHQAFIRHSSHIQITFTLHLTPHLTQHLTVQIYTTIDKTSDITISHKLPHKIKVSSPTESLSNWLLSPRKVYTYMILYSAGVPAFYYCFSVFVHFAPDLHLKLAVSDSPSWKFGADSRPTGIGYPHDKNLFAVCCVEPCVTITLKKPNLLNKNCMKS